MCTECAVMGSVVLIWLVVRQLIWELTSNKLLLSCLDLVVLCEEAVISQGLNLFE